MIQSKKLLTDLKKQVTLLENDLRKRCKELPEVDAPLRGQYEAAKAGKRTAMTYGAWLDEQLTQVAVAWVLACVFVRFLEDNGLVEVPKLAGPGALGLRARDEHELFFQKHPTLTEREYLEGVFTETGTLPAMREFFDRRHNPLWQCGPSGDAAAALLDFWRKTDPDSGLLVHDFTDPEWNTRFLGDLYQDLSEAARKKYALLQTPEFIEEFILDRTLGPAIDTFGYQVVRMIDPTCGSGHFLLGGFFRMFRLWQRESPGENPRVLAQNALNAIHGVDLNPYAVAIARFRLLLAALQVCGITKLKNAPDFSIHLASGDSLLHGARFDNEGNPYVEARQELFGGDSKEFKDELKHHYEVEDIEVLHRILGQQYHAVVGNPPYITVKDSALSELYRDRYQSCHRKYSLSVPFMERFFDLAIKGDATPQQPAGFVGQITANSFMKREFGKKLIEEYLKLWDLTHVIDASGAYIPGHGTPTVILFGRNSRPVAPIIRSVMGIKGEPGTPSNPSKGVVWLSIVQQVDHPGSESEFVSTADTIRNQFYKHPWSIGGGGASDLLSEIVERTPKKLKEVSQTVGYSAIVGDDDAYVAADVHVWIRKQLDSHTKYFAVGDCFRDWTSTDLPSAIYPLSESDEFLSINAVNWHFWPLRTQLRSGLFYGQVKEERGLRWWDYAIIVKDKLYRPESLVFAFVSTHNNFVFDRTGFVSNKSAPGIKLPMDSSDDDYLRLLGLLNSSTGCFWMQQVFHCKGGPGGGSSKDEKWHDFYEFDGTKMKSFPVPDGTSPRLGRELDLLAQELSKNSPEVLSSLNGVSALTWKEAEKRVAEIRRRMISLQEELDWQCYRHYGLIDAKDQLEWPEDNLDALPPLILGERAFEIRMAQQMATGEFDTKWFSKLGAQKTTELPGHWPDKYGSLVKRRMKFIENNKNLNLIERTNYKRRWETESWVKRRDAAITIWLLLRLETYFHGSERMKAEDETETPEGSSSQISNLQSSTPPSFDPAAHGFIAATRPHLVSAQQLAEVVQADLLFLEVAECLEGHSGFSVSALVQRLVEAESVPALPRDRYKDSGLRKREDWEETWRLQRAEDAVEAETRGQNPETREEELKKRIRTAQLAQVGEIPVPPKYGSGDFKKASFWKLRGKLDVPKERWISYPGAERDGDTSPVIAWAGWDHLDQAKALAEYFLDAKDAHGWPPAKLKPLLAALADLLPWLKQWHNTFDPNYGMGLGDYFQGFLEEQCRALEMTVQEVDTVRFEVSTETARTPARKQAKKRGRKGGEEEDPDAP
jgi:hypothetical protein